MIDRGFLYTGQKGYLSLAHTDEDVAPLTSHARSPFRSFPGSEQARHEGHAGTARRAGRSGSDLQLATL